MSGHCIEGLASMKMAGIYDNPSLERVDFYKVVAAFDIGTTFSGYAYSTKSNPQEIFMNKPWGSEFATETYKTPTAVLTNESQEFMAFGYEGKRMYSGAECKYHLYDQYFKMELYKAKNVNDDIEIKSRDGKQSMPLLKLMTMTIHYLYKHLLEKLEKAFEKVDEQVIRVVLTVPAIWPDYAKNFMKHAACNAGISQENLILALEPETASLYCRTLKPAELQSTQQVPVNLPNGTRYIVLDCGGGTVDISVHEVVDGNSVKEVHCANGGPWGGSKVNKEFEDAFENLFGKDVIDRFKDSKPHEWFQIISCFELIKRKSDSASDVNINLPYSLIQAYNRSNGGKDIENDISEDNKDGFVFKDGRIIFSNKVFKQFFNPSIECIIKHVRGLWENNEVSNVKYAFMVGGFSECELLYKRVTEVILDLNRHVQVILPNRASIAVLQGAVHFGHRPNAITSRILRMTYGVGISHPFDPNIHDEDKKIIVDNVEKCNHLFSVWGRKNEEIPVGEKRTFPIFPHSQYSTDYTLTIYGVDSETVMYTTEPGVQRLASLRIPIPDKHLPKHKRVVKNYVYFGGTELHVRIEDTARADGASKEATVSFFS